MLVAMLGNGSVVPSKTALFRIPDCEEVRKHLLLQPIVCVFVQIQNHKKNWCDDIDIRWWWRYPGDWRWARPDRDHLA
jgi:hypothetical protein